MLSTLRRAGLSSGRFDSLSSGTTTSGSSQQLAGAPLPRGPVVDPEEQQPHLIEPEDLRHVGREILRHRVPVSSSARSKCDKSDSRISLDGSPKGESGFAGSAACAIRAPRNRRFGAK